eukprot:5906883-Pleurochrysis_carterae.AAC.3
MARSEAVPLPAPPGPASYVSSERFAAATSEACSTTRSSVVLSARSYEVNTASRSGSDGS